MPTRWTPAGQYRFRVDLQEDRGTKRSDSGQHKEEWITYASVWAAVEPLSGREFFLAQQVAGAITTHRVKIRYRIGVSPLQRVLFRKRVLSIESVINLDERNIELHLMCTENLKPA